MRRVPNLAHLLHPTPGIIDQINLSFYLRCSSGNLERWTREVSALCAETDPREANAKLEQWMEANLHSQRIIGEYWKRYSGVLEEAESIVLGLKERHYPRVMELSGPSSKERELREFLRDLHEKSIRFVTKYVPQQRHSSIVRFLRSTWW